MQPISTHGRRAPQRGGAFAARPCAALALSVFLLASASPARPDTQAIDLTSVGTYPPFTPSGFNYYQPPGNYTFGVNFTLNSPVAVTELGYYDAALGGVTEPGGFGSHLVSLIDVTTGQTLATAMVTGASPATGLFNYAAIASKTLNTTDTYSITGTMTTQYYAVGVNRSTAPVAPQINISTPGGGDIFGSPAPPGTLPDFGPNFEFVAATLGPTPAQVAASVDSVAVAREHQMITTRLLSSILVGANEQVNCSSCGSGFASVGSLGVGAHARWSLTDRLALLAGFSLDQFDGGGVNVAFSPMLAAALRYDLVDWGKSRPFFEAGVSAAPYQQASFTRAYAGGVGQGSTIDRDASVYGRIGWVARLSPIDEAAVYADLSRSWEVANAYSEATTIANPYAASYSAGVDSLYTARIGAQYTRLVLRDLDVNINAGVAHGFGGAVGVDADVSGYGALGSNSVASSTWAEYGARLGYHISQKLVLDTFVLGTLGGAPSGTTIHGGLGLRYAF